MDEQPRPQDSDRDQDHEVEIAPGQEVHAWTIDGHRIALAIDETIYSRPAILRTAYSFTNLAYIFLHHDDKQPGRLIAIIAPKLGALLPETIVGDFANELIDQQLRQQLQEDFGPVQTLIVAQAFAAKNLLDPDRDDGDYNSDPQGASARG